ncbi:MAG: hypothetical protein IJT21_04670 [Synergistaceae bacterium]|nr:hypothetical protein [Synergistaceae bacterium]
MYTIKFADNSELKNLELNGNNFISQQELTPEFFTPEKLANIEISYTPKEGDDESMIMDTMSGNYENVEFIHCTHYQGVRGLADGYYFTLNV